MLQYPSILGVKKMPIGNPCVAFYKYDGSNLRFEWSPKKGWNKFGSRTQMIDSKHEVFGRGIEMFQDEMGQIIVDRIKNAFPKQFRTMDRITAFAEFYGENSFAGSHVEEEEKHLKLFDVFLFKTGFLLPDQFISTFGDWDKSAEVVYQGKLNQDFIQQVRNNALNSGRVLNEGVICKGMCDKVLAKKFGSVWMTKIKTLEYLDKLKNRYADNWENYAE